MLFQLTFYTLKLFYIKSSWKAVTVPTLTALIELWSKILFCFYNAVIYFRTSRRKGVTVFVMKILKIKWGKKILGCLVRILWFCFLHGRYFSISSIWVGRVNQPPFKSNNLQVPLIVKIESGDGQLPQWTRFMKTSLRISCQAI